MDQSSEAPKILIAPLDWGLGHATRCIPVIRALIKDNCTVLVAASGNIKSLLSTEFPGLRFLDLPGYNIEYAASGWGLAAKIVAQIPKLLSAIKEEEEWLQKIVEEEKIDAVISDNRYGLQHPNVRSIFITHQLLIKAPVKIVEDILQKFNYQYIDRFSECWVPDAEGEDNLAGILSHPTELPNIPVKYIWRLSRFENRIEVSGGDYLLALLSGPEPQRSILEQILLEELKDYQQPIVLVRGLPHTNEGIETPENVRVFNHLPAKDMEQMIMGASMVIARCGYSTVMDLAALKKRSILIPTPGQTEQEYLAEYLMKKGFAFCVAQKKFRLSGLSLAQSFRYEFPTAKEGALEETIRELVTSLNNVAP